MGRDSHTLIIGSMPSNDDDDAAIAIATAVTVTTDADSVNTTTIGQQLTLLANANTNHTNNNNNNNNNNNQNTNYSYSYNKENRGSNKFGQRQQLSKLNAATISPFQSYNSPQLRRLAQRTPYSTPAKIASPHVSSKLLRQQYLSTTTTTTSTITPTTNTRRLLDSGAKRRIQHSKLHIHITQSTSLEMIAVDVTLDSTMMQTGNISSTTLRDRHVPDPVALALLQKGDDYEDDLLLLSRYLDINAPPEQLVSTTNTIIRPIPRRWE